MINFNNLTNPTHSTESLNSTHTLSYTTTPERIQQEESILTTFRALSTSLTPTKPTTEASHRPNFNLNRTGSTPNSTIRQLNSSSANSTLHSLFQRSTHSYSSPLLNSSTPSRRESSFSSGNISLNISITSEDSIRQKVLLQELEKAEDELEQHLKEALDSFSKDPTTQQEAKKALFALTNSETKNLSEYWISILNESLSMGEGDDTLKLTNLLFITTIAKREALGTVFTAETKLVLKSCFFSLQDPLSRNRFSQLIAERPEIFTEPLIRETKVKLQHLQETLHSIKKARPDQDGPLTFCEKENELFNYFLASLSPKYNWEAIHFLNFQGYLTGNFSQIENFLSAYQAEQIATQDLIKNTPSHLANLETHINLAEMKLLDLNIALADAAFMIADRLQQLDSLETKTQNEKLSLERKRTKIEEEKELPNYERKLQNWSQNYQYFLSSALPFFRLVSGRLKRELQKLTRHQLSFQKQIDSIKQELVPLHEQLLLARKEQLSLKQEMQPQQAEAQTQKFHELALAAGLSTL